MGVSQFLLLLFPPDESWYIISPWIEMPVEPFGCYMENCHSTDIEGTYRKILYFFPVWEPVPY